MSDMGLRLTFEKALVPALTEAGGGVHHELGIGRKWDRAVAGEIEQMRRRPFLIGFVRADLQMY